MAIESPAFAGAREDLSGLSLGPYQIVDRLGAGGMAVVYRALQSSLGRELALKVLSPALVHQEGFVQRFEQEARTLARLDHPYILPIYDFATIDGLTFIATPIVRGGTLRNQLSGAPLAPESAMRYLNQIADALHHAHQVGVIHRDMKPSNVLIHADGRCVLGDFGLARAADGPSGLTIGGFALGTPGYMSPEQALGSELTPRADIYALGVMAFEMLVGGRPYLGTDPHKLVLATLHEPVPSARARNPYLAHATDAALARALAKDPDQRPASAIEFVHELTSSLMGHYSGSPAAPAAVSRLQSVMAQPVSQSGAVAIATPVPSRVSSPSRQDGPQTPVTPSSSPSNPTVSTLEHMGIRRPRVSGSRLMNSFFADALHAAEHVAGDHWMEMLAAAGLEAYHRQSPAENSDLGTPIDYLGRLSDGLEAIYGTQSPEKLRLWGALVSELDLEQDRASSAERRALKLIPGQQRRAQTVVKGFARRLDAIRGEPIHHWKQLDGDRFWLVIYGNPLTTGSYRSDKSCHFWRGALEARLRWAGLANDWTVSELECGSTNGTHDCVFAIQHARAL